MKKLYWLCILCLCIMGVPVLRAMAAQEASEHDFKKLLLEQLTEIAGQLHVTNNLKQAEELLDGACIILDNAASHDILFTDKDINPCMFQPGKGILFQLCAARCGHAKVVHALAKHHIVASDFHDDQGPITMKLMLDMASQEAKYASDKKKHYIDTLFALHALEKKQQERALLTQK